MQELHQEGRRVVLHAGTEAVLCSAEMPGVCDVEDGEGGVTMNGDLIFRSALLEELYKGTIIPDDMYSEGIMAGVDYAIKKIEAAPAVDAVEVVRCKDCKHFCPYEGEEHKGDCDELVGLESCVYEDDFCSYGERRADNATD
jgi:hypothetical protein